MRDDLEQAELERKLEKLERGIGRSAGQQRLIFEITAQLIREELERRRDRNGNGDGNGRAQKLMPVCFAASIATCVS